MSVPVTTPKIECPRCDHPIMDGEVTRGRVMRHYPGHSESKCPRCKTWVKLPLVLVTGNEDAQVEERMVAPE